MGFMSNPFARVNVKSAAIDKKQQQNLNCNHYTTFKFGEVRPVYYRHLYEGDDITVNLMQMVRCAPLNVPTYSDVRFRYKSFFVPYRLVFKWFYDFFNDNKVQWSDGSLSVPRLPIVTSTSLTDMFLQSTSGTEGDILTKLASIPASSQNVSFNMYELVQPATKNGLRYSHLRTYIDTPQAVSLITDPADVDWDIRVPARCTTSSSTTHQIVYEYLKLTPKGKSVLKILYSLGYKFEWLPTYFLSYCSTQNVSLGNWKNTEANALGLLSFFLVFNEFYTLSQYRSSRRIVNLIQRIEQGLVFSPNYWLLQVPDLLHCFLEIEPIFESNYFTSAWQSPSAVVVGAEPIESQGANVFGVNNMVDELSEYLSHIDYSGGTVTPDSTQLTNNPVLGPTINTNTGARISSLQEFAQRFKDFVRRRLLSGSTPSENTYAEMGVKVPNKDIDFVQFLQEQEIPLNIMDVTNTAASDVAKLGEYGGRAIAPSNPNNPLVFKYSADEKGLFLILAELRPQFELVQGFDRHNIDKQQLDFFRPDFEDVALQPILQGELCSNPQISLLSKPGSRSNSRNLYTIEQISSKGIAPNQIFGFTPRYAHIKSPQSWLTGDFAIGRLNGINEDLSPYHLATIRGLYDEDSSYVAQGDINYVHPRQYNRIFAVDTEDNDQFFAVLHFEVKAYRKMLSISNSMNVQGKGDTVEIPINGN